MIFTEAINSAFKLVKDFNKPILTDGPRALPQQDLVIARDSLISEQELNLILCSKVTL